MRSWIPALAWALIILVVTLMPAPAVPSSGFLDKYHFDKVVHAVLFGVLLILVLRARGGVQGDVGTRWAMVRWPALLVICFGALTEVLQELLPFGRYGDLWDLLADSLGVSLAAVHLIRASAKNI